jgi:uncharacterized protein (TIGR03083 family)
MSRLAIDALHAERRLVLDLIASLTPEEWAAASDCAGWRVQDVVAHMAATFHAIADPSAAPAAETPDVEQVAEVPVAERRAWTPAEVAAEYEEWSTTCIGALTAMQDEPLASTVIPLGNLGAHPMHLLANALVFDHYCHLRWDLLAPHGPLVRAALPSDDLRLTPTLDWMLAGIPQMCPQLSPVVDRPFVLRLTGPDGGVRAITLTPGAPYVASADGVATDAAAIATSSAHTFVCWGTRRRDWRTMDVSIEGDATYGASVLDAINVI